MTYLEKLCADHPENQGAPIMAIGCPCSHPWNYCDKDNTECARVGRKNASCADCWNREMPEEPAIDFYKGDSGIAWGKIQDSGERQEFVTGAVRDIQKGKGRCDLMPLEVVCKYLQKPIFGHLNTFLQDCDTGHLYECLSLFSSYYGDFTDTVTDCTMFLEVARHFEEGAEKYGENNWQKGLPAQCYINSAIRHYLKWLRGDKDEPHDRAFVWNLMCCIWEVDYSPRALGKENATGEDYPMAELMTRCFTGPEGESEPEVKVAYLCDKKSCAKCDNPDCHHTLDIEHAKNFERVEDGRYMEKANGCKLVPVTKDADPVRLEDYAAGVFEFADCLHVRAQATHVGNDGIVCIEVLTGVCHVYQPDILVQPMELWEVDGGEDE